MTAPNNKLIITTCVILALTGCATTAEKIAKDEQRSVVLNSRSLEAGDKISAFQTRLVQAKIDNLNYFAPDQLEDAIEEFEDAKEEYDDILEDISDATNGKIEDINEYLHNADKELKAAYLIKSNAESILAEAFDIKKQLNKLNAKTINKRVYSSLMEDIDDVVEEVADGDLEDARSENATLLPKLRAFEITVVKKIELSAVNQKANLLKKARANRLAPISYQQAIAALKSASATISSDPRNNTAIKLAVKNTEFQLDRSSNMLTAVKELAGIRNNDREGYLLNFETQFYNISQALGDKDFRNLRLNEQTKEIITLIADQNKRISELTIKAQSLQASSSSEDLETTNLIKQVHKDKIELEKVVELQESKIAGLIADNSKYQENITNLNDEVLKLKGTLYEKTNLLLELQNKPVAPEVSEPKADKAIESPSIDSATVEKEDSQEAVAIVVEQAEATVAP